MKAALIFVLWIQGTGIPIACINTTYSRSDEVEITNDLGHLIIGAFAHHGPAFYENEVKRCLSLLEEDPQQFEARNDLGAAYTKLGMWEKAQAAFDRNEELHPGRYDTASNLGVMYKKMGNFAEAESWIRKSLELKPGGHMGLGDYYLRMIRWQEENGRSFEAKNASEVVTQEVDSAGELVKPTKNFLGVPYNAGPAAAAKVANKEYVVTLIKNDMSFSDAYLVLGDIFFDEGDFQMALRAYHRASSMSYEQEFVAHALVAGDRQMEVISKWQAESHPGYVIEEGPGRDGQLESEIIAAATWLEEYQKIEEEFIQEGRDVSFVALKPEVEKRGFGKPRLIEAVYYEGTATQATADFPSLAFFVVGLLVAFVVIVVPLSIGGGIIIYFIVRNRSVPAAKKLVKT